MITIRSRVINYKGGYDESKHWYDSPERIQQCLNCTQKECTNCFVSRSKRIQKSIDMRKLPAEFAYTFVEAYLTAEDDFEIGRILNRSQSTVCKYRIGLNFPPPSRVSAEERKRIVEEWKKKAG